MIEGRRFDRVAWAVTAVMVVLTLLFMNGSAFGIESMERKLGYEDRLFDNSVVHTIDIVMDDWDEFIASATSEEYSVANVVIDGESYRNVAIRGKGNTSLSTVATLGSQRYSFKIEFDHYDKSKSYHGLDKLSLNNLIQDSTMMKDYLTYTAMREFGATTPLCSFVYITVNGKDWGLYLAVEGVEDSFIERNYTSGNGNLYKPDSLSFGGGRGNGKDFDMSEFEKEMEESMSDAEVTTSATTKNASASSPMGAAFSFPSGFESSFFSPSSSTDGKGNGGREFGAMGGGFNFGGFGMGSGDVKLQYIDDDPDSYSNIWNNAKTTISSSDQKRLINSLKTLSQYRDIESVVDTEAVMRYFVVHNYVSNGDSYTGSMIHNYYLYEEDGVMSMIPWDYNLAYGTFMGGNGNSTINTPIDAPVSGSSGEDRPMWYWILSSEEYTERYHELFSEFLSTVDLQAIINDAYSLIKGYVEKDPTAFYSIDEFEKGVETLKEYCRLRSESISMQLSTGNTTRTMNYADGSSLSLSLMGSMGGSMGRGGGAEMQAVGAMPGMDAMSSFISGGMTDMSSFSMGAIPDMTTFSSGGMPDTTSFSRNNMPDTTSFSMNSMPDTSSFSMGGMPDTNSFSGGGNTFSGGFSSPPGQSFPSSEGDSSFGKGTSIPSERVSSASSFDTRSRTNQDGSFSPPSSSFGPSSQKMGMREIAAIAISVAVLAAALIFVVKFKKR